MDKVTLVDFIFMMCELGGPFGSGGVSLYLVGVCFGESWDSKFPWCCFTLLSGYVLCCRCSACFMFLSGGWDIYPLVWRCLSLSIPC